MAAGLNLAQLQAVHYTQGPCLVLAGAGSGKTRVITHKIARLIETGMAPRKIAAITFTNKAASEMRERAKSLIGRQAKDVLVCTFHALGVKMVREDGHVLGLKPQFSILDSDDVVGILKDAAGGTADVATARQWQWTISKWKNMGLDYKEALAQAADDNERAIAVLMQRYDERLTAYQSVDFDDLIGMPLRLLRDHPEVRAKWQTNLGHVLVDEYQDTNLLQARILQGLKPDGRGLTVVGDDAQSIYSFRGANIDNILKFQTTFPETRVFKLEQNYRSTRNIVSAANSLIKKNTEQIAKEVFSKNEEGEKIEVLDTFSDFEEGLVVANKIARKRLEEHASFSDFAILYRTNAQSRIFEESLRKKNIPYRIYGGLSFYHRKEIKDAIGYFRLIVNPGDEEAFRRIINYPRRGIGDTTVGKISSAAQRHSVSLWSVLSAPLEYNLEVNAGTANKLSDFQELINEFIEKNTTLNTFELAQEVIKNSGIASETYGDLTPEGMSRAQNIQELLNAMSEFVSTRQEEGNEEISLVDFLSEVSLLSDQDTDKEAENEKVTLMTVHAAKGLEFNHVFVVGMEEDLFPSAMVRSDIRGLEEERRLFYVAITRAKKSCTITYAKSRFKNGVTNTAAKSRFLKDIDPEYLLINEARSESGKPEKTSDSFWGSMREQRLQKEANSPYQRPGKQPILKQMTPAGQNTASLPLSKEAKELQAGHVIEHERFGRGVVTSIEMSGNDRRAFVEFDSAGKKQLLLKFAKFTIVG